MTTRLRVNDAAVIGLALVAVMMATLAFNHPLRFPLDDAYITIANARQLLTGQVDDYGQSMPSGATSLVHLVLLTALGTLLDLPQASMALAMLASFAYVTGLYLALRATGARSVVVVLGCLAGFLGFKAWFQLMNGLETGWAMAGVAWALYLTQRIDSRNHLLALAGLIALMPFLRPELAMLSATLSLMVALRWRTSPMRLVAPALLGLAIVAAMAALALTVTGGVLPLTAGAKVAFFAEAELPMVLRFRLMLEAVCTLPLGLVLTGFVGLPMIRGGWAFPAFAAAFLVVTAMTLPGGLMHNDQRYLYPLLPMALTGWAAIAARSDLLNGRSWQVVSLAAAAIVAGFFVSGWRDYRESMLFTDDQMRMVGWAEVNLPRDARILIHDAGYIGWAADYRLVDLVGLKTPESIEVHRRFTLPSVGRDRSIAIARIAAQQNVTHAIILDRLFWRDIAAGLRRQGWELEPLRKGPGTLYQVYRLTPPAADAPKSGPSKAAVEAHPRPI